MFNSPSSSSSPLFRPIVLLGTRSSQMVRHSHPPVSSPHPLSSFARCTSTTRRIRAKPQHERFAEHAAGRTITSPARPLRPSTSRHLISYFFVLCTIRLSTSPEIVRERLGGLGSLHASLLSIVADHTLMSTYVVLQLPTPTLKDRMSRRSLDLQARRRNLRREHDSGHRYVPPSPFSLRLLPSGWLTHSSLYGCTSSNKDLSYIRHFEGMQAKKVTTY
jgi:hypothetical protein